MWTIDVLQQGRGKQEEGRASIFVAEEVHVTMLHRHLCLADPARKSWEAILGSRYFGPAKVVKEPPPCYLLTQSSRRVLRS